MLKISLVTDEVSSDYETAVELAAGWGLKHVEIRGVGDERIGAHSEYARHHIRKINSHYGMKVTAVSPGLFKIAHDAPVFEGFTVLKWQDRVEFEIQQQRRKLIERHLREILPRTIEFCQEVGCRNIVIFSFFPPENSPFGPAGPDCPEYLLDYIRKACEIAQSAGMLLLMENEHICYGDTAQRTRRIIEQVGFPNLKLNWDPGNSYFARQVPYPDAYSSIRDLIGHVHMKDASTGTDNQITSVVEGAIDWEGQIQALLDSGYDGFLSIETHCRPKIESAFQTLQRILAVTGRQALG